MLLRLWNFSSVCGDFCLNDDRAASNLIFGPLLTLLAALLSWRANIGKKAIACLYPVLINAIGVSAYVASFYNVPYVISLLSIGLGESVAAVLIGYPLLATMERIILKSGMK